MSRLTRDGTAEPVSRYQTLRHERGQGNNNFPCSADHEQGWQPYPVDPYFCYMCNHTYIMPRVFRSTIISTDTFNMPHAHFIPIVKERRILIGP